jgi:hypothetical protein
MSEHSKPTRADARDTPVIPDGGLGSSMPEWLRRPPTWKQVADAPPTQQVPEPDTSLIDPATFLEIDDLPAWLQAVARRVEAHAAADRAAPAPEGADEPTEPSPEPARAIAPQPYAEPPLDATPAEIPTASLSRQVEHSSGPVPLSPGAPEPAWWMSEKVIGALMLAVLLALIYVILVATEVI